MERSKIILIGILVFVVILAGVFLFLGSNKSISKGSGNNHIVELTDDGFVPDNIDIKKGDTVTFRTNMGKPFWPASNIHPTHGIYPEFDPMDAVMPEDSWSFTFEKTGEWQFHDHLAPYYTGVIRVTE